MCIFVQTYGNSSRSSVCLKRRYVFRTLAHCNSAPLHSLIIIRSSFTRLHLHYFVESSSAVIEFGTRFSRRKWRVAKMLRTSFQRSVRALGLSPIWDLVGSANAYVSYFCVSWALCFGLTILTIAVTVTNLIEIGSQNERDLQENFICAVR